MELRHLTYFVTVAKHLNFSRAAEELHIAQPAISQQIHSLEKELGAPLFERIGRRVQLTDAGLALLPRAREILSAVEAARNEIRDRGALLKGTAKLGAPPTVSVNVLPTHLTAFEQRYPGIDVTLREAGTDSLLKYVEQGILDLAIVTTDVLPANIECVPFLEENYVVAVGLQHALCGRESVTMAELANEAFILFPEGYKLREVTLNACHTAGFEPKVALDGGGTQTTLQFVAAGLGIAIIPELALQNATNICSLTVSDQILHRSLGIIWRKGQYLSPAARALRDFLLK
jgi:LysR family transcriptional regulator, transcription activator of glutamate synthase operon